MADAPPADRSHPQSNSLPSLAERGPVPVSLPAPLTSFVGRTREVESVTALLRQDGVRLVTLTGPGGVGKTRLALRVASQLEAEYADGVVFVGLASITDPALVLPAVALALGIREAGVRSLTEQLMVALRERELLLVLDNFEQVVEAAPCLSDLLVAAPLLRVLATSRVPLSLSAEHRFPVPPLSLPLSGASLRVEDLARSEAVSVFVTRARAARPDFALTEANAEAVAAICARLDGLPLAIELAAARVTHLPPSALLRRLDRRLPLLTGGARNLPERQQTMAAAIAWSHDLLSPEEQGLFRCLAVFVGGFDLEAAEAVSSDDDSAPITVLEGVASLTDKSLVREEGASGGEPRYQMLETVREYALERLEGSGEEATVRALHATHFLALAERTAPLMLGPQQHRWFAQVERDHGNFRAALAWFEQPGDGGALLRLTAALGHFWEMNGYWSEGSAWLERALVAHLRPSPARAEALNSLGQIAAYVGDFARAERALQEALALVREVGSATQIGAVLLGLGSLAVDRGAYAEGEALLVEALAQARRAGHRILEAGCLTHRGIAVWGRGDAAEATAHLEAGRQMGQETGSPAAVETASRYLAHIAVAAGDLAGAARRLREVADYDLDRTQAGMVGRSVPDVASLAAVLGEPERAARLFGVSAALAEATGLAAAWPERDLHARGMEEARAALGGDACEAALAAGRRLPKDHILAEVDWVLEAACASPSSAPVAPDPAHGTGLTARELEVLGLIAEGRSNREIAEALFVSPRTVDNHVTAILAKLEAKSRTAAVAAARRLGLA